MSKNITQKSKEVTVGGLIDLLYDALDVLNKIVENNSVDEKILLDAKEVLKKSKEEFYFEYFS